jgi:hypothetical protein
MGEYKTFWKSLHNLGIRTHDLMHTARLIIPLHHERWCWQPLLRGISLSLLEAAHYLPAGVERSALAPSRAPSAGHDVALRQARAPTCRLHLDSEDFFQVQVCPGLYMYGGACQSVASESWIRLLLDSWQEVVHWTHTKGSLCTHQQGRPLDRLAKAGRGRPGPAGSQVRSGSAAQQQARARTKIKSIQGHWKLVVHCVGPESAPDSELKLFDKKNLESVCCWRGVQAMQTKLRPPINGGVGYVLLSTVSSLCILTDFLC